MRKKMALEREFSETQELIEIKKMKHQKLVEIKKMEIEELICVKREKLQLKRITKELEITMIDAIQTWIQSSNNAIANFTKKSFNCQEKSNW